MPIVYMNIWLGRVPIVPKPIIMLHIFVWFMWCYYNWIMALRGMDVSITEHECGLMNFECFLKSGCIMIRISFASIICQVSERSEFL